MTVHLQKAIKMPTSATKRELFPSLWARTVEVRKEMRARLSAATKKLNRDEMEVVVWLAERMAKALSDYGPLVIDGDPRNFQKEAGEEAIDGLAYLAMESIRLG